jgi:hypothetical protein
LVSNQKALTHKFSPFKPGLKSFPEKPQRKPCDLAGFIQEGFNVIRYVKHG